MKYFVITMVSAALAVNGAFAQDWAKAKLEKSPRHGEWVEIKHGDRDVKSFITYPEVKDKATAVVVIHEIFGLSPWAQEMTDELAEAGYIAIAPDLLSGAGPDHGGPGRGGEVRLQCAVVQRQGGGDGILLGRRADVPVCDEQQED